VNVKAVELEPQSRPEEPFFFQNPFKQIPSYKKIKNDAKKIYLKADPKENFLGKSPLQALREKKGLSQKILADRLSMDRTRVVRLEKKTWKQLSLSDLALIAQAFDMNLHELMTYFSSFFPLNNFERASLHYPAFAVNSGDGVTFNSFFNKPDASFMGTLRVAPQRSLYPEKAPRAQIVFYSVLEGELVLILSSRQYVLKEFDCIRMDNTAYYELYNPHQLKEALALLFTVPSFVRL